MYLDTEGGQFPGHEIGCAGLFESEFRMRMKIAPEGFGFLLPGADGGDRTVAAFIVYGHGEDMVPAEFHAVNTLRAKLADV